MRATPDSLRAAAGSYRESRSRGNGPEQRGLLLAKLESGTSSELRIAWDEAPYNPHDDRRRGAEFSIRLWSRRQDGVYWPIGTVGVAIPFFQMADFADAVARGLEKAEAEALVQDQRRQRERTARR